MSTGSKVTRLSSVVIAVVIGAAACSDASAPVVSPEGSTSPPAEAPAVSDVLGATVGGGDAKLRVAVQTHMPPDFDDGIPDRAFVGEGFLDRDRNLAGINYEMSDVPNSAGYFGQVDGEMNVFYSGSEWIVSFALMTSALPGRLDWLSYDLEVMADPAAQELGIGQLREVGLADPRLGLALLEGAESLEAGGYVPSPVATTTPVTPSSSPAGPAYRAVADVARAAETAHAALRPLLEGLADLAITQVELGVMLDADGRVGSLTYGLTYPPKEGSEPVQIQVTHEFLKYGLTGGLNPPTGRSVASFREYTGI